MSTAEVAEQFKKSVSEKYSDMKKAFKVFDRYDNGFITRTDFRRGIRAMGIDMANEDR